MLHVVRPFAKRFLVCDDVVLDTNSGKVTLLNLWNAVRVPPDATFPFQLAKLCLFVCWRDGLGSLRTRVELVQASTGESIRTSANFVVEFTKRNSIRYARYLLEGCVCPEPGEYWVELYCEDEFVDDQVIHILASEGDKWNGITLQNFWILCLRRSRFGGGFRPRRDRRGCPGDWSRVMALGRRNS